MDHERRPHSGSRARWSVVLLALAACSSSRSAPTPSTAPTAPSTSTATSPASTLAARPVTATIDWGSAGRLDPVAASDDVSGLASVGHLAPLTDQRPGVREVLLGRYTGGDNGPPPPGRLAYVVVLDPATCLHSSVPIVDGQTTTTDPGPPFCVSVYDARTADAIVGIFKP